jgi:transposase
VVAELDRVAPRYDKLAARYQATIHLAAINQRL